MLASCDPLTGGPSWRSVLPELAISGTNDKKTYTYVRAREMVGLRSRFHPTLKSEAVDHSW